MRPDKVTLAGLAATLGLYRAGLATREIPLWRAIAASEADLRVRAEQIGRTLNAEAVEIVGTRATIGGGSLPGETLPSVALLIRGPAARTLTRLRQGVPSVVARIERDAVLIDLRSVPAEDDASLTAALGRVLAGGD
jgi:L-seryl-tRNA(Ser) seleniumtransferase